MSTSTRIPRGRRAGEKGIALVIALFVMAVLTLAAATGLQIGGSGIKATRNYRGAGQVHFVAESALSQGLQLINGAGVINFQNEVVNQWGTLWGNAPRPFAPLPGFSYTLTAVASAANPANAGRLIATATGVENVRNTVVASILRSNIPSTAPGAIYLASDTPTNAIFNGNAFAIDGNDHNYTGGMGPGAPVPGLSTRTDVNTQEALSSLGAIQKDNITGLGYSSGPPLVPSVKTSPAAPTSAQLDQMINTLKQGIVPLGGDVNGSVTFGTPAAPQITYFNGSTTIKANGNASGAGIMIVEGDLTIQGSLNFKGLILVKGRTQVVGDTTLTGNATVYGSIWTNDINLVVGGSAIMYYSTQALALANQVAGGNALPAPLRVTALVDCAQVPAGAGGCP